MTTKVDKTAERLITEGEQKDSIIEGKVFVSDSDEVVGEDGTPVPVPEFNRVSAINLDNITSKLDAGQKDSSALESAYTVSRLYDDYSIPTANSFYDHGGQLEHETIFNDNIESEQGEEYINPMTQLSVSDWETRERRDRNQYELANSKAIDGQYTPLAEHFALSALVGKLLNDVEKLSANFEQLKVINEDAIQRLNREAAKYQRDTVEEVTKAVQALFKDQPANVIASVPEVINKAIKAIKPPGNQYVQSEEALWAGGIDLSQL